MGERQTIHEGNINKKYTTQVVFKLLTEHYMWMSHDFTIQYLLYMLKGHDGSGARGWEIPFSPEALEMRSTASLNS